MIQADNPQKGKGLGAPHTEAPGESQNHNSQFATTSAGVQQIAAGMEAFNRLRDGFQEHGWRLYPLHGEATVAVCARWGMHQVCQSHLDAQRLLSRIGRSVR